MNNTNPKEYETNWKAAKARAEELAEAFGKPVTIYREAINNRPGAFKHYVEGDAKGRPDDAWCLETVQPKPKTPPRKVIVTVTDANGVVLDRQEGTVRPGVYELTVMEVLPGTTIIEHQVADLTIGTGQ